MSDEYEVMSLEEYGRWVKTHRGDYQTSPYLWEQWKRNNQKGNDDAGEPENP